MTGTQAIHPAFVKFFKQEIRVLLNWERMFSEEWGINLVVTDNPEVIADWYMPWNVDQHGCEVRFDAPGAHPIRIGDIGAVLPGLAEYRQNAISRIANSLSQLAQRADRLQIVCPTYQLPNNQQFILDGNHRIAAIFTARIPFVLMGFSVQGPLERSVLPELMHWEHPGGRSRPSD